MYKVLIHRQAKKQLRKISSIDQVKIARTIRKLSIDPLHTEINIKSLQGTKKSLRARAGNLRIIYSYDTRKKVISIESLGYRGNMCRLF